MGEHLPSGKSAFSSACKTDNFHRLIIRVCPPQEVLRTAYGASPCGGYKLCEHVIPGNLIFGFAGGKRNFRNPRNRV